MRRTYRTWLFDCDGVVLNSNGVKSEAMGRVTERYGSTVSEAFVAYHQEQAGVSRYAKFEYLFAEILRRAPEPGELEGLLEAFGALSAAGLADAPADPALLEVLTAIGSAGGHAFVVSGGDQAELRSLFEDRGWSSHFDGIYGSPTPKGELVRDVMASSPRPAVMFGDSELDYQVAMDHQIDFVFVFHWTEMHDWEPHFAHRSVAVIEDLSALLVWLEAAARA